MLEQIQNPMTNTEENINLAELLVPDSSLMVLSNEDNEILRFERNGDIFVKGKLITNDMEVVDGFRELLQLNHLIN